MDVLSGSIGRGHRVGKRFGVKREWRFDAGCGGHTGTRGLCV